MREVKLDFPEERNIAKCVAPSFLNLDSTRFNKLENIKIKILQTEEAKALSNSKC